MRTVAMPYHPATLKNSRTNRDMESIGAGILEVSGPKHVAELLKGGWTYHWNISFLGLFQWGSTIAMLVIMVANRDAINEIHAQIHGTNDEEPIFNALHTEVMKIRGDLEGVEGVSANGEKVFGLKAIEHMTLTEVNKLHKLLTHVHDETGGLHELLTHLDGETEEQRVDLGAFIEHHADDVECADCRENVKGYLVGEESRFEARGHNDCGFYYCVPYFTPEVTPEGCVRNVTSTYTPSAATCLLTVGSTVCVGNLTDNTTAFNQTIFTSDGTNATCGADCTFTDATRATSDGCAAVATDKTTGVATCEPGCVGDGNMVIYTEAVCRAGTELSPVFPTNDTVLGNGTCHAKCRAYDRTGSEPCYEVADGTPGTQLTAYLSTSCESPKAHVQLFNEDHYRKHSVCEAHHKATEAAETQTDFFDKVIAALGDGTTKYDTGTITGPRAACQELSFCA